MWLTPGQRKNGKVDAKWFPRRLTRRVLPLEEVPYPEFRPVLSNQGGRERHSTNRSAASIAIKTKRMLTPKSLSSLSLWLFLSHTHTLAQNGKQFTLTSTRTRTSASSTYQHLILRSCQGLLVRGLFFLGGGHQTLLVALLHYFRGQIRRRAIGRFHLPVHHPLSLYSLPLSCCCCLLPQAPQNAAPRPLSLYKPPTLLCQSLTLLRCPTQTKNPCCHHHHHHQHTRSALQNCSLPVPSKIEPPKPSLQIYSHTCC